LCNGEERSDLRIGVILAGGKSSRMGTDKAEARLDGRRLIDLVIDRLRPQTDVMALSARSAYGTGLPTAPDLDDVSGPVAGIYGAAGWIAARFPEAEGFLAVPVDGPVLPEDLFARLSGPRSAIAVTDRGPSLTVAWWRLDDLQRLGAPRDSISLKDLAAAVGAREVHWPGADPFVNLNTPQDLAAFQARARAPKRDC
jgi:molybdopterin-guanine dinucleotide biosynthesis protein A